ncbi:MAG: hypothetical protein Fur0022_00540 [Anaerolineales bacterium]
MKPSSQLFLASLLIGFLILLSACSVELSQTPPASTKPPAMPTTIPTETATPTELPPSLTPTATQPGDPTLTPTPSPTPTAAFPFQAVADPELNIEIRPEYAPLNLQGRLLFLSTLDAGQALVAFDLSTGNLSTLFIAPPKTWVLAQSVFPDASEILIAYAPPPPEGKPSYGYTDLYILNADDPTNPEPILQRTTDVEAFFGSFFSPAGDYVYYSHFFADSAAASGFRYNVNRFAYPGGSPEVVVEDAFWERLSPDGTKLAYVTFDGREFDELFVANADGSHPVRALNPDEFPTIDAPFFSPDNQFLYFSAVSGQPTPLTWWEKLMGVQIAFARSAAHTVPSDFWRVSLTDGTTTQITNLMDQGMYGTFSPDGETIAFFSATGLYVVQPDGSGLIQVLASTSLYGLLEWIP